MSNFMELIEANTHAANLAAHPNTPFDDTLGDLVLRNTVVVLDRLDAAGFYGLSPEAKRLVNNTAYLAADLAPIAPENEVKLPHETAAEYAYRLDILNPIGNLQRKLNAGNYNPTDSIEISKVKKAIHIGATAFAAVAEESIDHYEIRQSEDYFWGNTRAAVGRAERLTK